MTIPTFQGSVIDNIAEWMRDPCPLSLREVRESTKSAGLNYEAALIESGVAINLMLSADAVDVETRKVGKDQVNYLIPTASFVAAWQSGIAAGRPAADIWSDWQAAHPVTQEG